MIRPILTAFVLFTLTIMSNAADTPLEAGKPAPDFELPGSDGKTYKLADFKGKQAVVLAWYPKAFTGGWTAECKSLRASGPELKKFNVAYFTASCDSAEDNKKFAESMELDYPILSDPGHKVAEAYGVVTDERRFPMRWTFFIDKEGNVAFIDKKVKPGNHGAAIAAKLKELGVEAAN